MTTKQFLLTTTQTTTILQPNTYNQVLKVFQEFKIENEKDYELAHKTTLLLKEATKLTLDPILEEKKKLYEPYKTIQQKEKDAETKLNSLETLLKSEMLKYYSAEQKRKADEEAKLEKEREKLSNKGIETSMEIKDTSSTLSTQGLQQRTELEIDLLDPIAFINFLKKKEFNLEDYISFNINKNSIKALIKVAGKNIDGLEIKEIKKLR